MEVPNQKLLEAFHHDDKIGEHLEDSLEQDWVVHMVDSLAGLGMVDSVEDNRDSGRAVDRDRAEEDNLGFVVVWVVAAVERLVFQVVREPVAPDWRQFVLRKMLVEALEDLHDSLVADSVEEDGLG